MPVVADAQEGTTPSFVYATYFECDVSKQERADDIVNSACAPVYDAAVEAGTLSSWGWMAHRTGGKWRRAVTFTGTDVKTLLATRGAMLAEIKNKDEAAGKEFSEICGSHQDYIWNVVHEKPLNIATMLKTPPPDGAAFFCTFHRPARTDSLLAREVGPARVEHGSNPHG